MAGCFALRTRGPFRAGDEGVLRFTYRPEGPLAPGTKLWLLYDIRQGAGAPEERVAVRSEAGAPVAVSCYGARTLDLYPQVPEFLHVCEFSLTRGLEQGAALDIRLGGTGAAWEFPRTPIGDFRFWLVEGGGPGRVFAPTGYKTYRTFAPPLSEGILSAGAAFAGAWPRPAPQNTRTTPGILWGDLHGMAFNQRPLDDFYAYAREVAGFDFAAALLFSYNICVGDVWAQVTAAARRFTCPGEFVAVPGIEFGTPPDGSHRNVHFFTGAERVPPLFCEERPPALDPNLSRRFHPDVVRCRDLADFYAAVGEWGGIVSGHFHTLTYGRESLAEIWQKQAGSAGEEQRIFDLLDSGMRMGIIAGSDTHDSMPGNPDPEPGCPQPAGFAAVLGEEISPGALRDAVAARRVYGTTGARIALYLDASGQPMGSALPGRAPRRFRARVEGAGPLARVELVRRGAVVDGVEPVGAAWEGMLEDPEGVRPGAAWYLVRVAQRDGHRAWSSPFWFA